MAKSKTAKGIALKQIEMRRCVACRQVHHKSELLRLVKTSDGISIDTNGKLPGRGAYVCKSPQCAELIKKRRNLDKIFRVKVPSDLYDTIKEKILM